MDILQAAAPDSTSRGVPIWQSAPFLLPKAESTAVKVASGNPKDAADTPAGDGTVDPATEGGASNAGTAQPTVLKQNSAKRPPRTDLALIRAVDTMRAALPMIAAPGIDGSITPQAKTKEELEVEKLMKGSHALEGTKVASGMDWIIRGEKRAREQLGTGMLPIKQARFEV